MRVGRGARGCRDLERGQETLQMILAVSFVLLPVLFSTVQVGNLLHLWIGQQAATAAGARLAGELGEDSPQVRAGIDQELQNAGIDPAACTVDVTPSVAEWNEPITVRITSTRHVAIPFLFTRDVELVSQFTARGEVNH
ncbi:MAG: hypothetical protein ACYDAY_05560 [Candidatus Dormibacteria bacterium]